MPQHPKKVRLLLMRSGQSIEVEAEMHGSGFDINAVIEDGDWNVLFMGEDGNRFPLGMRSIGNGKYRRPLLDAEPGTPMDLSALPRLHTLLRRGHEDAKIRVFADETGRESFWGKLKASSLAPAGKFFQTEFEVLCPLSRERSYVLHIEFTGIAFRIETVLLDIEQNVAVWRLPSFATRLVRRTAPRHTMNWEIDVRNLSSQETLRGRCLADLSPLGCGFLIADATFEVWDQLEITIKPKNNLEFKVPALIVELAAKKRVGCVFACDFADSKTAFFSLLASYVSALSLHQNAEDAWDCLEKNGYLDLLQDGQLRSVRDACTKAWKATDASPSAFQPVAAIDAEPVGTIAAIQVGEDHWIPHSLATSIERKYLSVTETLYQSWPLYMLAKGSMGWFSTWYDADKEWHNRFYQVFIQENKQSKYCFSFVRRWYWSPELRSGGERDPELEVRDFDARVDADLVAKWVERYGEQEAPILRLQAEEFFVSRVWYQVVIYKGEKVGIVALVTSKLEMNPLGVFNVAHLNIFLGGVKEDSNSILSIVKGLGRSMKEFGMTRAAITMDYDCEINLDPIGFMNFAASRCLTAKSSLLRNLISNNALCFADMRARYL